MCRIFKLYLLEGYKGRYAGFINYTCLKDIRQDVQDIFGGFELYLVEGYKARNAGFINYTCLKGIRQDMQDL